MIQKESIEVSALSVGFAVRKVGLQGAQPAEEKRSLGAPLLAPGRSLLLRLLKRLLGRAVRNRQGPGPSHYCTEGRLLQHLMPVVVAEMLDFASRVRDSLAWGESFKFSCCCVQPYASYRYTVIYGCTRALKFSMLAVLLMS